ncbi:Exonuclease GOR; AltName: Full=Antigen GOR; AltName: Full=RNA exonuclease 1 homolog-like [Serendipita indica DSM 11827]|uniref:Related to exonuclease GOR n=1 Tax=Serendipita indica (strain DSM 11827) TaxID=1109443 RepID=G4T6U0_SERID|nr:Exonuclease GOR; AltName: Full=Antigen GOR; AltName: Full=RNA exonuclease 1 homolog-like [Serendipita indica DSM 11827]CCA67018.1 related to exonuclease GOR [Serendipita indica DSM 11827]
MPTAVLAPPSKIPRTDAASRPSTSLARTGQTATFSTGLAPQRRVEDFPKFVKDVAGTKVPFAMRQALFATMYSTFKDLYHRFHQEHPNQAFDDAVMQEAEVYAKSNKTSYKNAMISSIASLKKRPVPDKLQHPSVGSEGTRAQRSSSTASPPEAYTLTLSDVEPLLLTTEVMRLYGIPMEIPSGPGGTRSDATGEEVKCDRCGNGVILKPGRDSMACQFHWGRVVRSSTGGEISRTYGCCSAPYPGSAGCQFGPHVFMEKDLDRLHARHAFTSSCAVERPTQLDIATIDCEGIYTTQGMSVARVSVCDGSGKLVFDEFVRPDDGVEVIDFNTRFSGVTSLDSANLDLVGIRQALDALIGPRTVIIGHAVENDLMMLRMIHPRLVDTIVLFPSNFGLPFKRALRVLAREYLGRSIQQGGAEVGHSSAEDALATLDLVKHYVLDQRRRK